MDQTVRVEHDLLGDRQLPRDALYGIHTARAIENFPLSRNTVHPHLVTGYGAVKLACARVNAELGVWQNQDQKTSAILQACTEMAEGLLTDHVLVDALQGGAGTSTNMNVNEVIANRALQIMGASPGEYHLVSPLDDINRHQSTNDTFPTAVRVAAHRLLSTFEQSLVALQESFQTAEQSFSDVIKVARTEYQDAVLITLGREMGAYAEAFNRDRWRVYKCQERLRVVNLGGTAVGTGFGAPRRFIFRVVERLREITGIGFARAENLIEATQNTDVFPEVSGILKACASNLLKISSDLRLLSSGPEAGLGEIHLPARQAGSSIMPGKVNPVIPEAVSQCALKVIGDDLTLTMASAMGSLELNAFYPLIGDCLLRMIDLLERSAHILRVYCIEGIEVNRQRCQSHVDSATATVTALLPMIGYQKASEVVATAQRENRSIREVAVSSGMVSESEFDNLVSPEAVCRLGFPDPVR